MSLVKIQCPFLGPAEALGIDQHLLLPCKTYPSLEFMTLLSQGPFLLFLISAFPNSPLCLFILSSHYESVLSLPSQRQWPVLYFHSVILWILNSTYHFHSSFHLKLNLSKCPHPSIPSSNKFYKLHSLKISLGRFTLPSGSSQAECWGALNSKCLKRQSEPCKMSTLKYI